jgi:hypothetical protein
MIYYNRTISDDLLDAARLGGPLGWLVPWVRSDPETRLDFRREDGQRTHGGLQVYVGRTSPVEFLGRTRQMVRLTAGKEYQAVTPGIFGTYKAAALGSLRTAIEEHIADCRARMPGAFTSGEAVSHNGLMRRYGMAFQAGDRFLAVDSEIAFGFRGDDNYSNGTEHKADYKADAGKDSDLPAGISPLRKLDALGVLPDGDVAVVEVKDAGGNLAEAARQATAHVYNLRQLMQSGGDLASVLNRMIAQKVELGLVSKVTYTSASKPKLVPVVAAPDPAPDWTDRWTAAVAPVRKRTCYLDGLRFWRLSTTGTILEEHRP